MNMRRLPRGLLLPANGRGLTREDLAAIPEDATLALLKSLGFFSKIIEREKLSWEELSVFIAWLPKNG